ncbi:MAG: oxalate/formate MFS antiporter [Stellaceae bacterium]
MTSVSAAAARSSGYRWFQLAFGTIAMMAVSSPEYLWTLFTRPLDNVMGTTLAEIQITFSMLIVVSTFCSPLLAFMVDRFGPRLLFSIGALMSGGSWILSGFAPNIWTLYLTYGIVGGIGLGIIGVGSVGVLVRWFPDRRGLAVGILQAGFGFGPVFTSFPINSMINASGYQHTLIVWGLIQGVIGLLVAQGMRLPPEDYRPAGFREEAAQIALQGKRSYTPREMLQNPIFYLLFIMMSMMATSGLMIVSNVAPIAYQYKVAQVLVLGLGALPLSLTLSRFTNGLTRPFFGWVSDHIGREFTMALAFSLEALAILVLFAFLDNPVMFVVLTGLVFFGWGEIFSLFPATLTDAFGSKYATTNYGFLYIAQGVGSILGGPVAAFLKQTTGSWTAVFAVVVCLDVLTAVLAVTALRPLRLRHARAQ